MFSLSRLVQKNWSKTWQENWPRNVSDISSAAGATSGIDAGGSLRSAGGPRGLGSYLVAGIIGALIAPVSFSACTKVSLLNPDSNSTDVGLAAPTVAPVTPVPMPIAGTAILTGGGISTGTGPSGEVMKVISTIGEPLVIAGTGGESIQKNADMQVIPGLQGTLYQNQ